jgi:NADH dehydrogenase
MAKDPSERVNSSRVVVIGAGFGGLWAARALARAGAQVLLLDCNNYHTFHALLYQVAAAELEPADIAQPVRTILRRLPQADFMMAGVQELDLAAQTVRTKDHRIGYDFLVVALGSQSSFFSVPGAAEHAFPLKTLEEGVALRNHILRCFEKGAREPSDERRRMLLTFTVVGGGATGVEFAGALAELIHGSFAKDFASLDLTQVHVLLLEGREQLLPGMPEQLQEYALARLRRMGVDVRTQALVSEVGPEAVRLTDGTALPSGTVVWTAGVRGHSQAEAWGLPTKPDGRVPVLPTLQVPGLANVYAVGDLAYVEEDGRPLPMLAPVAIQEGVAAARNIVRQMAGQQPLPFRYHDRGAMATVGRNAAVARLGRGAFTGFFAWLLWLVVHLVNLIGFRNRLLVLISWAWDYFFFERAVRLILPSEKEGGEEQRGETENRGQDGGQTWQRGPGAA